MILSWIKGSVMKAATRILFPSVFFSYYYREAPRKMYYRDVACRLAKPIESPHLSRRF